MSFFKRLLGRESPDDKNRRDAEANRDRLEKERLAKEEKERKEESDRIDAQIAKDREEYARKHGGAPSTAHSDPLIPSMKTQQQQEKQQSTSTVSEATLPLHIGMSHEQQMKAEAMAAQQAAAAAAAAHAHNQAATMAPSATSQLNDTVAAIAAMSPSTSTAELVASSSSASASIQPPPTQLAVITPPTATPSPTPATLVSTEEAAAIIARTSEATRTISRSASAAKLPPRSDTPVSTAATAAPPQASAPLNEPPTVIPSLDALLSIPSQQAPTRTLAVEAIPTQSMVASTNIPSAFIPSTTTEPQPLVPFSPALPSDLTLVPRHHNNAAAQPSQLSSSSFTSSTNVAAITFQPPSPFQPELPRTLLATPVQQPIAVLNQNQIPPISEQKQQSTPTFQPMQQQSSAFHVPSMQQDEKTEIHSFSSQLQPFQPSPQMQQQQQEHQQLPLQPLAPQMQQQQFQQQPQQLQPLPQQQPQQTQQLTQHSQQKPQHIAQQPQHTQVESVQPFDDDDDDDDPFLPTHRKQQSLNHQSNPQQQQQRPVIPPVPINLLQPQQHLLSPASTSPRDDTDRTPRNPDGSVSFDARHRHTPRSPREEIQNLQQPQQNRQPSRVVLSQQHADIKPLHPEEITELSHLFSQYDVNGDSHLALDEVSKFLRELEFTYSEEFIMVLIEHVFGLNVMNGQQQQQQQRGRSDSHNNNNQQQHKSIRGQLTFPEFLEFMQIFYWLHDRVCSEIETQFLHAFHKEVDDECIAILCTYVKFNQYTELDFNEMNRKLVEAVNEEAARHQQEEEERKKKEEEEGGKEQGKMKEIHSSNDAIQPFNPSNTLQRHQSLLEQQHAEYARKEAAQQARLAEQKKQEEEKQREVQQKQQQQEVKEKQQWEQEKESFRMKLGQIQRDGKVREQQPLQQQQQQQSRDPSPDDPFAYHDEEATQSIQPQQSEDNTSIRMQLYPASKTSETIHHHQQHRSPSKPSLLSSYSTRDDLLLSNLINPVHRENGLIVHNFNLDWKHRAMKTVPPTSTAVSYLDPPTERTSSIMSSVLSHSHAYFESTKQQSYCVEMEGANGVILPCDRADIVARCCRVCLVDGSAPYSNIHTVKAELSSSVSEDTERWSFHLKYQENEWNRFCVKSDRKVCKMIVELTCLVKAESKGHENGGKYLSDVESSYVELSCGISTIELNLSAPLYREQRYECPIVSDDTNQTSALLTCRLTPMKQIHDDRTLNYVKYLPLNTILPMSTLEAIKLGSELLAARMAAVNAGVTASQQQAQRPSSSSSHSSSSSIRFSSRASSSTNKPAISLFLKSILNQADLLQVLSELWCEKRKSIQHQALQEHDSGAISHVEQKKQRKHQPQSDTTSAWMLDQFRACIMQFQSLTHPATATLLPPLVVGVTDLHRLSQLRRIVHEHQHEQAVVQVASARNDGVSTRTKVKQQQQHRALTERRNGHAIEMEY